MISRLSSFLTGIVSFVDWLVDCLYIDINNHKVPNTYHMGVSENRGTPKSSHFFSAVPLFSPSILGENPYFWKHLPYHHIIKLPILKHHMALPQRYLECLANATIASRPFFSRLPTERMDIGPIWMFHLTSQMRWEMNLGDFCKKKKQGFLLILGFRIHWSAFFGGKFHQKRVQDSDSKRA